MEKQKLHLHLGVAFKESEIRRACCAVEAIVACCRHTGRLAPGGFRGSSGSLH